MIFRLTAKDFVPLDIVYKLVEGNVLVYKSDDPAWGLSCFILVAMGNTSDGHFIVYQGRLPFTGQAPHTVRISIDGEYFLGPKFGRKSILMMVVSLATRQYMFTVS